MFYSSNTFRVAYVTSAPFLADAYKKILSSFDIKTVEYDYSDDSVDAIAREAYDYVLVELSPATRLGSEFVKKLQQHPLYKKTPIGLTSEEFSSYQRIDCYAIGAIDCISRNLEPEEVSLRIKKNAAFYKEAKRAITVENLTVYLDSTRVNLFDEEIRLTFVEYRLIVLFALNRHSIYTKQELVDMVWGKDIAIQSGTIHTHLANLSEKLEKWGYKICSRKGVGFILARKVPPSNEMLLNVGQAGSLMQHQE